MNKKVFITGATSGIGAACAQKFASAGYDLFITGRRKEKLIGFADELQKQYKVPATPLAFDVRNKEEIDAAIKNISGSIDILINNSGLAAGRDPFDEANIEDYEQMIHTNVMGVIYVTKALLPQLKKSDQPQIINIGSIAAKEIYPNGIVYCASKSALDVMSHGMRIDLLKYGIKVTAVHPGAVETEFSMVRFKGDEEKAKAVYDGFKPLTAEDVADVIFYTSTLPAHVCINDLVVTPTAQADSNHIFKS